jgi:hypothetical protein
MNFLSSSFSVNQALATQQVEGDGVRKQWQLELFTSLFNVSAQPGGLQQRTRQFKQSALPTIKQ